MSVKKKEQELSDIKQKETNKEEEKERAFPQTTLRGVRCKSGRFC